MADVAVKVDELLKDVTINVRFIGIRKFKAKLWIVRQLLKLASLISGMDFKFEDWPYQKPDIGS